MKFYNYLLIEKKLSDLDMEFIRKAEKVTSFNLSTKDFESLKYKKEIQYLFVKNFFPNFDLSKTVNSVDVGKINAAITELKQESSTFLEKLHYYKLSGVGPGEVTLYFLINNAYLGGGSSAGVDLVVGSEKYEVKAIKLSKTGYIADFKLGGTFSLAEIMTDLAKLNDEMNLRGTKSEIPATVIEQMRRDNPKEFNKIETKFQNLVYDNYFKNHDVIFINNGTPKSRFGLIERAKKVRKNEVSIERVTSGTIKPRVLA